MGGEIPFSQQREQLCHDIEKAFRVRRDPDIAYYGVESEKPMWTEELPFIFRSPFTLVEAILVAEHISHEAMARGNRQPIDFVFNGAQIRFARFSGKDKFSAVKDIDPTTPTQGAEYFASLANIAYPIIQEYKQANPDLANRW